MKCQVCGTEVLVTGYKDQHGEELWIGDTVWISWGTDDKRLCALARIVAFLDDGNTSSFTNCMEKIHTYPAIQLTPGSIHENGELVGHNEQTFYSMKRVMKEACNCILLYRPSAT